MRQLYALILGAWLLAGCGVQPAAPEMTQATAETAAPVLQAQPQQTILPEAEAEGLSQPPDPAVSVILECEAPGLVEQRNEDAVIDLSNTADGYAMVCFTGACTTRLKARVAGPGATYTYNLSPGDWTVLPLSDGNGTYKVTLYRQVSGTKYATVLSATADVTLTDEFAPFLRPNQYVDYAAAPETMAMGSQLCTGLQQPLEKVEAVYNYVVTHFTYDDQKASTVKSGYLPVLDQVLAEQTGICFDYAAWMTAVLRSQQIPTQLVVGYAGSAYHAWINVWTEENGWVNGVIFFDGSKWKRMDPTFAAAQGDETILDFIENGTYTAKYLY